MGDFRRANQMIKRLGLGSKNNSRGDYNGTGYGDYGQAVRPSKPTGSFRFDTGWGENGQAIGPSRKETRPGDIAFIQNTNDYVLHRGEDGYWRMPKLEVQKADVRSVPLQGGADSYAPLQGGVEQAATGMSAYQPGWWEDARGTGALSQRMRGETAQAVAEGSFPKQTRPTIEPKELHSWVTPYIDETYGLKSHADARRFGEWRQQNTKAKLELRRRDVEAYNRALEANRKNPKANPYPGSTLKELKDYPNPIPWVVSPPESADTHYRDRQWLVESYPAGTPDDVIDRRLEAYRFQPYTEAQQIQQQLGLQQMQSSTRPAAMLKPQTPMMDNRGPQKRTVSKGFGTLPSMKKPMGYNIAPSGWMDEIPGGSRQLSPQDIAALESGFSTAPQQQAMPTFQPQQQYQPQQPAMPPQPVSRPPLDVDEMIDYWKNIKGSKAPLAEFMDNTRRSAGELPSLMPPEAQGMYGSPYGGPVGAPPGDAPAAVSSPQMQDSIQRFFTNGMRGTMNQMGRQEKMLNYRSAINGVDSMVGNVAAPVMGGLMSMFTGSGGGNEIAQQWNNQAYSRGNDLMNQRNQFINNAQQNTRDGFSMMQASNPNTMKNQIALMNAQANAQRASAYGTNVDNQFVGQQGNLDWKNRSLVQSGQQFQQQLEATKQKMAQDLIVHKDNLALAVQRNQISRQEAEQQLQIAQMNNNRALQQMSQQMQISAMEDTTRNRGIEYGAYNNYLSNQGANMRAAAAQHFDKDGNASPATAEWFRQMFGAPVPVQAPQQDVGGWFRQMFGDGQQQQPPQNSTMQAALSHYKALPPQQQQALRGQFMQKFGIDPVGN